MPEKSECGYRYCINLDFKKSERKKFCCDLHRTQEWMFNNPRIKASENQIALPIEVELKKKGIGQAESHSREFVEKMRSAAKRIALEKGRVCSDDLRAEAEKLNIKPHHSNVWGGIFNKGWTCIGRKKSEFKGNHAREIKVWQVK